jgi:hypothetical protein
MRSTLRGAALGALCILLAAGMPACNNSTGFGGFVGNTPNTNEQVLFKVLGTVGTPFTMLINDKNASWSVQGNVPMQIAIANNVPPVRMLATKLANDNTLLSVQITRGFSILTLSSTSQPYGTVSVQTNSSQNNSVPPAAFPDVRVFVRGSFGERMQSLIEDQQVGYVFQTIAPTLFLFESPNGKVDAQFNQKNSIGPIIVNMTYNGELVATESGQPFVLIRQP